MGIINFTKPITGNFLIDIIIWLVSWSSVVWGIVLFTVILKLITLPFDFFSRASMRKNSLKMEEMRPELEKLQKQYANDKNLYSQKMMALYKKNGYSMFGACLPTIITLVIFIVAINGFTAYSQYQNRQYFYDMSVSYNNVIYAGFELDESDNKYITRNGEEFIINDTALYNAYKQNNAKTVVTGVKGEENFDIFVDVNQNNLVVYTENGYVKYNRYFEVSGETVTFGSISYSVIEEGLDDKSPLATEENNYLKTYDGKDYQTVKGEMSAEQFIVDIRQTMSAKTFEKENTGFLWVKNVWVPDSATKHPVESDWGKFKQTHAYPAESNDIGQDDYNNLIAKLGDKTTAPNGYFILVALTAGISLLMQLVMSKSQKAQMELQTVDGQGAQTQKMMMWMMPIMMAIFAFMYTAAFSIYIIISSIISIGTTFLINFIVDRKFKKEKEIADKNKKVVRGRVYTPKEEKQVKKEDNKSKKNEPVTNDFLSGTADNKHVRGRIK